ncbi:MAG: DUF5011 domain-containing protein [Chitinispirillaceae bacterium]|nr:DUF5011 domain-containing protein [Chitinispirillaceae bacterium]
MKKRIAFSIWIVIIMSLLVCEKVVYDNPADLKGTNADNLRKNPILLEDDDNDGIVNVLDKDFIDTSSLFRDTVKPTIKLVGPETVYIYEGDPSHIIESLKDDYTATDNNGNVIVTVRDNINYFVVNEGGKPYEMEYIATDNVGLTNSVKRYVFVKKMPTKDTIPPTIVLKDTLISVKMGDPFTYPKATAYDDLDGDISDKIKTDGRVDVNTKGTYIVTYSVQDRMGNAASATLKVIVVEDTSKSDFIPPVITLTPPETLKVPDSLTVQDYYTKYYKEPGYKAVDETDGDITSKVQVSQLTSLSGSNYWFITYSVTDKAGNPTSKRRYFEGKGGTAIAPVIELTLGDSIIEIVIGSTGKAKWVEPGYRAYDVEKGVDITKNVVVDSSQLVKNLGTPGIYSVIYSVTSSAGVTTQVVRQVKVKRSDVDVTPPVIELKGRNPDTVLVKSSTSYKDPGYTAYDDFDGDLTSKVSVTSKVDMSRLGCYSVTYSAVNAASLRATVTRTVCVVRDTSTTNLLQRYIVPSPDPLPSLANKTFKKYEIDGQHDTIPAFVDLSISWDLPQRGLHNFALRLNRDPYHLDLKGKITHTFASSNPDLIIRNSGVSQIDGEYYVTYDNERKEFIWVDKRGRYAIIWQEK